MKLSDFVVREAILVDLQATGKEEAIREIVKSLRDAGQVAEADTMEGRWQLTACVGPVRRTDGDQSLVSGTGLGETVQIAAKLIDRRQIP